MKVKRAFSPKKVLRYLAVFLVGWISYRIYSSFVTDESQGRYKPFGPRDIGQGGQSAKGEKYDGGGGPEDLDVRLKQGPRHANQDKQRGPQEPDGGGSNPLHRQHAPGAADRVARARDVELESFKANRDLDDQMMDFPDDGNDDGDVDDRLKDRGAGRKGERKNADRANVAENDDVLRFGDQQGRQQPPAQDRKKADTFEIEPKIDWALEEELQKRRKSFLDEVAKRAEEYDPQTYKDMHERDDHLAFVTVAGEKTSWLGLLQFIYSVQYFYPDSDIGVYDLGLSQERREKLQSYCRVSVIPTYMKFWPEYLRDLNKTLWRPMIWQMALAHYGHMVFVEPERFLSQKNMKEYIEHSRRHGITVVGRKLPHSPYVVTHPEMYYFLSVDTRKLQRVAMFEPTMIIMHNAEPVRHEFMRFLVSCSLEEYCISPPGSQSHCDHRLYPGSKKYANCHRYDLSAMNIVLYKWFGFNSDDFLVRDIATAHYDGRDVTSKVRTCAKKEEV